MMGSAEYNNQAAEQTFPGEATTMSISLAEALQQVKLEAGKTYRCKTPELLIEVRVQRRPTEPSALPEADIMLDAWVDLPHPPAVGAGRSKLVQPPPPTVPDIPAEDET